MSPSELRTAKAAPLLKTKCEAAMRLRDQPLRRENPAGLGPEMNEVELGRRSIAAKSAS